MTHAGDVIVDPTYPTITLEMARIVFDAIEPADLCGWERADYEQIKTVLPQAQPEDAERAWAAVTRIANYLPFRGLAATYRRIDADAPFGCDAEYAFIEDLYHLRVEFCAQEGVDIVTGGALEDFDRDLNRPEEVAAFNAIAELLGQRGYPMQNPDNWRRYRLNGQVRSALLYLSHSDRDALRVRLAALDLPSPVTAAGADFLDQIDALGRTG